ncbi:hypothetical protein [Methylobacterium radiodurans]|uniref:hypothetical protein n=1 Tax=Methylobacterium radiodurans TaxID=2202828 RepID=UPI0013A5476F|nr:hypothetical protein [Methylobacterium radiodurans]
MIEALDTDYEKNPVSQRSVESRRQALNLIDIARLDRGAENRRTVEALFDEKVDDLIATVSTFLRERTAEARRNLEAAVNAQPETACTRSRSTPGTSLRSCGLPSRR